MLARHFFVLGFIYSLVCLLVGGIFSKERICTMQYGAIIRLLQLNDIFDIAS